MARVNLMDIAKLRLCVGYLGEIHQNGWWQCSFLSSNSDQFLMPTFEKTAFFAKYYGIKKAAEGLHDLHIGTGKGVYHLFRLPENIEIELHINFGDKQALQSLVDSITTKENCEQFLRAFGKGNIDRITGPVRIGGITDIDNKNVWYRIGQYYLDAFREGYKVFPYFSRE